MHAAGQRFALEKPPRQLSVELSASNLLPLSKELIKLNQLLAKVAPTLENLTLIIPPFMPRDQREQLSVVSLKKLKQLKSLTIKCLRARHDSRRWLLGRENHLLANLLLSCRNLAQLSQVKIHFPPLSRNNPFALHLTQTFSQLVKHFSHDFTFEAILNLNGNIDFWEALQAIDHIAFTGNINFLTSLQAVAQIKHEAKSPKATEFTLALNSMMDVEDNCTTLNSAIARLTELTGLQLRLKFNLNSGNNLGGALLNQIMPADEGALFSFTQQHKLKHLAVDVSSYSKLSPSQLIDFGMQLEKLPALVDLAVSFKLVREMDQPMLVKLATSLTKLSNLTDLKLTIGENYNYPELSLVQQLHDYLHPAEQAKLKELDQTKTARTWSAGLASLLSAVGNLAKLERLELNVAGAARSVDNEFVYSLAYVVAGLPNLKEFSLNMAGCYKLNNQGLTKLANLIKDGLAKVTSFELNVSGCFMLTTQGFGAVKKAIEEHAIKFISVANPSFECNFKHDPQQTDW
jgi:hypothetical protein